jgi:hypothetical protein
VKKWFITLLFVFACLPVIVIKAAPSRTYIHLEDYKIINGYHDLGDGAYNDTTYWGCSNMIQIPKNVDKIFFSHWAAHYILFFGYDQQIMDYWYIGYYHDAEYAYDNTWFIDWEEHKLGEYDYTIDEIRALDVPTNATHLVLQQCRFISSAGLSDYLYDYPTSLSVNNRPLVFYPAPTDAATNMTFGLMPALMIMIVIAGVVGGLIMITKKSKR